MLGAIQPINDWQAPYRVPWTVPTWDQVGAIVNLSGALAQQMLPGFPVELAELTWLLGDVPGGVFFPSDQLAVGIYDVGTVGPIAAQIPNSTLNQLEIMLQNGIPFEYVEALWERAKGIAGGAPHLPDYAAARSLTFGAAPLPAEYVPSAPATVSPWSDANVLWIDGTTGRYYYGPDGSNPDPAVTPMTWPPVGWTTTPAGMPWNRIPDGRTYYPADYFTQAELPPVITATPTLPVNPTLTVLPGGVVPVTPPVSLPPVYSVPVTTKPTTKPPGSAVPTGGIVPTGSASPLPGGLPVDWLAGSIAGVPVKTALLAGGALVLLLVLTRD